MKINEVLVGLVLTEKATNLAKNQTYMFEVHLKASKPQIKTAVEKLFPVKVAKVRLFIRKGKVKKVGRRMKAKKTSSQKLAYVKLREGKLDLFPQT